MAELECVPNVSEGRRPEVVERLVASVSGRPGAALLDVSSDADHNRTVLTLAGDAEGLHQALLALYERALEDIDLGVQHGAHPRLGAVDVVPFVALGATPTAAAVAAARRLGAAVAERFALPVYFYEEAARDPRRRALPDLRRGGLEGLAARMAEETGWAPDFGPSRPHPTAGVTVVGARFFLVAFNALLDTAEVEVARQVAAAVRESSGGLPAVRALGLALPSRGAAQVSMNLLDYRRTSLAAALARVEEEAAARGARVVETEIVGLLPEEAALGSFAEWARCPGFSAAGLLEERLRRARKQPG